MASFEICCPKCAHDFEVNSKDCADLEDAIDDAVENATDDLRAEIRRLEDDYLPARVDARQLGDLACAIRSGNQAEAEYLLDKIAESVGDQAQHEVSLGRFRRNPVLAV